MQKLPLNFQICNQLSIVILFPSMRAIKEAISLMEQSPSLVSGKRNRKPFLPNNKELLNKSTDLNPMQHKYLIPTLKQFRTAELGDQQAFGEAIKTILSSNSQLGPLQKYENLEYFVFQMQKQVLSQGGVVELGSIGCFQEFYYDFVLREHQRFQGFKKLEKTQIELIRQLLFSYEFWALNQECELRLYEIGLINFVGWEELREKRFDKQWGLRYFGHDLTLFQEGAKGIEVDQSVFSIGPMTDRYRNQEIDIRIQNPHDYGFKARKLTNRPYKMRLGDYQFYQENYRNPVAMQQFPHLHILGKGQILFGVNFEPADNFLNDSIQQNVGNTFLDFHSSIDLLSYLDEDVPGCSSPQMYFKTLGCWTGGHQENICMSALNINHGPSYSQWYTLQLEHVPRLRKQLIDQFGMDLIPNEGLWYEKLDWFVKQGYPVKRFLQRKDDIVVTGPGTLHWVRSYGVALQTSWNIFPKLYHQFLAAFSRQQDNRQVQFPKSSIIPLKSLTIKYLNHERLKMDPQIRELCTEKLEGWLQQELQQLNTMGAKHRRMQQLTDLASFCSQCYQEILLVYTLTPEDQLVCCLSCCDAGQLQKNSQQICLKYREEDLAVLITLCKSLQGEQTGQQIQRLCNGKFVGKTAECLNRVHTEPIKNKHKMPHHKAQRKVSKGRRENQVRKDRDDQARKRIKKTTIKHLKMKQKQSRTSQMEEDQLPLSHPKQADEGSQDCKKGTGGLHSGEGQQLLCGKPIVQQHQQSQAQSIQTRQCGSLTAPAASREKVSTVFSSDALEPVIEEERKQSISNQGNEGVSSRLSSSSNEY